MGWFNKSSSNCVSCGAGLPDIISGHDDRDDDLIKRSKLNRLAKAERRLCSSCLIASISSETLEVQLNKTASVPNTRNPAPKQGDENASQPLTVTLIEMLGKSPRTAIILAIVFFFMVRGCFTLANDQIADEAQPPRSGHFELIRPDQGSKE